MSAPGSTRLYALDALRGLAVFLMMEQHLGIWLWRIPAGGAKRFPGLVAFNALGGMAAPLFISLAGVGGALMLERAGAGSPAQDRVLARRGLALIGFGYALNLMTPRWLGPLSWFVLHLIGFGLLTLPLWRRLASSRLLALAGALVVATPLAHAWLGTPLRLGFNRMADHSRPGGALRLALVEGHFPIIPWLALFLVGVVVGRWISAGQRGRVARLAGGLVIAGALLGAVRALTRADALPLYDWIPRPVGLRAFYVALDFYPAHPPILALLSGLALGLIYLATGPRVAGRFHRRHPLVTLGRASLTLLIVHVVLFNGGAHALELYLGLSARVTLLIIGVWTALCLLLVRRWERAGFRYGAEWLLRRLAG
ncbi:MAG: DUF418 domain-containing transporter [Myxococcales bacterium]|nr:DUF418 domain-containing transporter [Myxococcales bacterium]